MINNVPVAISGAARAVTRRHPNSIDCVVYRKVLTAPAGEQMGGLPTLGGMGVLKSEDDPDFEYKKIGPGKILVTGVFSGGEMTDQGDNIAPDQPMQEAQIVSADDLPGFEVQKGDLIGMMPGGGVLIGFEIIGKASSVAIYPYVAKWVIAPRDELHDLTPWKAS